MPAYQCRRVTHYLSRNNAEISAVAMGPILFPFLLQWLLEFEVSRNYFKGVLLPKSSPIPSSQPPEEDRNC